MTDVNLGACRMLGYERDELIGKTILDIIPPEEVAPSGGGAGALLVPGQVDKEGSGGTDGRTARGSRLR